MEEDTPHPEPTHFPLGMEKKVDGQRQNKQKPLTKKIGNTKSSVDTPTQLCKETGRAMDNPLPDGQESHECSREGKEKK